MQKPDPEDFGITTEGYKQVKGQLACLNNRRFRNYGNTGLITIGR
jgi:hypothetical protein